MSGGAAQRIPPCRRSLAGMRFALPPYSPLKRLSLPMQPCPSRKVGHQIADQAARHLVVKIAVGVEFGLRLTDQHFRLVERIHIEKDAAAPQIVLRPGAARHAGGGADDRTRLAGEG